MWLSERPPKITMTSRMLFRLFPLYLVHLLLSAVPSFQVLQPTNQLDIVSSAGPRVTPTKNKGSTITQAIPSRKRGGLSLQNDLRSHPVQNKLVSRAIDTSLDAKCRSKGRLIPSATEEEKQFVEFSVIWNHLIDRGHFTTPHNEERVRVSSAHNRLEDPMSSSQRSQHIRYYIALRECASSLPQQGD